MSTPCPRCSAPHLVATLTFDSRVQDQFVGLRAARSHVRRMLYQVHDYEVDLEITPQADAGKVRLAGQATMGGLDPGDGFVRLSKSDIESMVPLEESGEFWLDAVPSGAYRLEVVLSNHVIELPFLLM
jgi:hypothetical protein